MLPMKHPSAEQTDDIIIRSVIMMMDPPHSTVELSTEFREGLQRSLKPPVSNDLSLQFNFTTTYETDKNGSTRDILLLIFCEVLLTTLLNKH